MPIKDKDKRNENARKNAARRMEAMLAADPERAAAYKAAQVKRQLKWREANQDKYQENRRKWEEKNKDRRTDMRREREGSIPEEQYLAQLEEKRRENAEYMAHWNRTEKGQRARCKRALDQNKHGYSLTIDEYDEMYQLQQGKCVICQEGRPQYGQYRMHVDHGHVGGQVRGLLCTNCNSALGKFKDNTIILNTAIQYLTQRGL